MLAIGQKWRMRNGDIVTINHRDDPENPPHYDMEGRAPWQCSQFWWRDNKGHPPGTWGDYDLVELIEE